MAREKNYACALYFALLSKKTVTLTKATAEAYRKKFHLSEKKVTNIYNGINKTIEQNAADYNPDEKTILSLGRISPEKRYDILTGDSGKSTADKTRLEMDYLRRRRG